MFGVGAGIRVGGFTPISGGGGFDPDAQAFFDRVTAAGGTLTTTEKTAANQLVLDMKAAGIWTSMKAVYPMIGASAAACAQNLKSSSFTGTFTSGWTFASTGVTGNGTSAYMDSGLNTNTSLTPSSAHISYYVNSTFGVNPLLSNNSDNCFIQPYTGTYYAGLGSNSYSSVAFTKSSAFYLVSRQSAISVKLIKNNTILLSDTIVSTTFSSANVFLNKFASSYVNAQCAFASIGDGLTDTQASDFYTAVQAFQTTLSRQV